MALCIFSIEPQVLNQLKTKVELLYINKHHPKMKRLPSLGGIRGMRRGIKRQRSIISKRKWERIGIGIQEMVHRILILIMIFALLIMWWTKKFFWCTHQTFLEISQHIFLENKQKRCRFVYQMNRWLWLLECLYVWLVLIVVIFDSGCGILSKTK